MRIWVMGWLIPLLEEGTTGGADLGHGVVERRGLKWWNGGS